MLSAKVLQNDYIPSGQSFMWIRNKNGRNTNLCGNPEQVGFHSEIWPFKTTLCS